MAGLLRIASLLLEIDERHLISPSSPCGVCMWGPHYCSHLASSLRMESWSEEGQSRESQGDGSRLRACPLTNLCWAISDFIVQGQDAQGLLLTMAKSTLIDIPLLGWLLWWSRIIDVTWQMITEYFLNKKNEWMFLRKRQDTFWLGCIYNISHLLECSWLGQTTIGKIYPLLTGRAMARHGAME